MTTAKHMTYRDTRRFVGGYLTLHAAGGVKALVEELDSPHVTPVIEMLLHEALKARHPEWYVNDYKHKLQVDVEAEVAQRQLAKLEAQLAEAQAKAEAAVSARDKAA